MGPSEDVGAYIQEIRKLLHALHFISKVMLSVKERHQQLTVNPNLLKELPITCILVDWLFMLSHLHNQLGL